LIFKKREKTFLIFQKNRFFKSHNCAISLQKETTMKKEKTIYQQNGYKNREDYLNTLAEDFGVPVEEVHTLACILGPNEDFDGLVSHVEERGEALWY
jgi:CRISPR/Cas system CMR-associated protein Cmr3 (group 5 of RAMP superfamily)